MHISAPRYLRVSQAAFVALYAIIITGSLVHLTGSGLGCADWPRCSESKFIDVSTGHAAIEQINRLFTGVVVLSVIACALFSFPCDRSAATWWVCRWFSCSESSPKF